eukprot:2688877-Rhodomonas_salina.1
MGSHVTSSAAAGRTQYPPHSIKAGYRRSVACYTPKSNTRNLIPGTKCTETVVSCIGLRGVPAWAASVRTDPAYTSLAYPATSCSVLTQRTLLPHQVSEPWVTVLGVRGEHRSRAGEISER